MELTDEQYHRIFKYAAGEMNTREEKLFERAMNEDAALLAEFELYKDIQFLYESAGEKIKNKILMHGPENKSSEEAARNMILQARQNWESKNTEMVPDEMASTKPERITKPLFGKMVNIQRWTMLAAATVLGVICLAALWYYTQNKQSPSTITATKKPVTNQPVATGKTTVKQPETHSKILDSSLKDQLPVAKKATQAINSQELFATNFKPDEAPKDKDASLEEPFHFYVAGDYKNASETFEMSKAALDTRGESQGVITTFYIHYYLAISYLASGINTKGAIAELKAANDISGHNFLKTKTQWYLALAYLKLKNFKETENLLKQLAANKNAGSYQQKALDLLGRLLL